MENERNPVLQNIEGYKILFLQNSVCQNNVNKILYDQNTVKKILEIHNHVIKIP